ncbi:MAG: hypothetical protein AAF806_29930 [Bacteroidota bacterium]
MDAYFKRQVEMPYFRGETRQRGSGLGTLAMTVGRTALPIFKKYLLPTAKRFGQDMLMEALPELGDVIQGKRKVKEVVKKSAKRSIAKQMGGGSQAKRRKTSKRPIKQSQNRKKNTSKINFTRRSRSDIFKNLD